MIEVATSALKGRSRPHGHPVHIDTECSNPDCRRSMVGVTVTWQPISGPKGSLGATVACTSCRRSHGFYLFEWPKDAEQKPRGDERLFLHPSSYLQHAQHATLSQVSDRFGKIWSESSEAEARCLFEVAGAGYRKSFEVLIKDFVIWESGDDIREDVIKEPLEKSIKRIGDEDLVECAKRAAWLANDQVHYAKVHEEHDLPSLKDLIDICADMISKSVRARNYVQNIVHRKL